MMNSTDFEPLDDSSHDVEYYTGDGAFRCDSTFCQTKVVVTPKDGLHMVPCSLIVKTAQPFDCDIEIIKQDKVANAKAIFDLLGLMAEHGTDLIIEARGKKADEAIHKLTHLFNSNFAI